MDFRLTKKQEKLKKVFEDFFTESMKDAPPEVLHGGGEAAFETDVGFSFFRHMAKQMGEKGWLSLPWPKEYGGQEASIIDQILFNAAREASGCPGYDVWACEMFAPTLLISGNEEQKNRLLPPIAKGEVLYCQGWSEPDAGSDLANISTLAIKDGDEYVLNGQKLWTSAAHRADRMFTLVRTDPESKRSRGLSVFHLDMKSPGIEVRPLHLMNGAHVYNEVYFKDVRVPARDLIGGEGNGWAVTQNTMNFERSCMTLYGTCAKEVTKIIDYVKKTKRNGRYLSKDPVIRQRIARVYSDIEAGKLLAYKIACLQEKGDMLSVTSMASESKVFASELMKRICSLATEVMGLYGMVEEPKWAPLGDVVRFHQFMPGFTISMGSNEIQRSIIAWTGLKLPRYKLKA